MARSGGRSTLRSPSGQTLGVTELFAPAFARLAEVYRRIDGSTSGRALTSIKRAVALEPHYPEYRLKWAQLLREAGREKESDGILDEEVQRALQTASVRYSNSVCWTGALWGMAQGVLAACDQAVELEPESASYRDSRAVAYLLAGQPEVGVKELRTALDLAAPDWSVRETRASWLEAAAGGRNPFTGPGAINLADDWEEEGFGWLR